MNSQQTAEEILDRDYLQIRAKLLEIAASLDRIERADCADSLLNDPRVKRIQAGVEILNSRGFDRAERIQRLFSDPYQAGWNRE